MHASIWRIAGDPDDLLRRYDALVAEIGESAMNFHVCLATDDGLLIVDTCASKEVFDNFIASDWMREALERHGLPFPAVEDHPVHVAFASGRRVEAPS